MRKTLNLVLVLCLSIGNAYSTEFFVTNNRDSGEGSLRKAILDANADKNNQPHIISPNTSYSITLGSALPIIKNNVTFNGTSDKVITINGNKSTTTLLTINSGMATLNYVVFDYAAAIASGSNTNATFNHCIFKNMIGTSAFRNVGSTVTFNNCSFTNNTNDITEKLASAFHGNSSSTSVFNDCVIVSNTGSMGAAVVSTNSLTMNRCIIADNTGTSTTLRGGGISSSGTFCQLTNCWIKGNSAPRGGGVTIMPGTSTAKSTLTMTNCTVDGNTANAESFGTGGGLYIQGSSVDATGAILLVNSTFSGNVATGSGGGINIGQGSTNDWIGDVTINNCTITQNLANGGTTAVSGGGISRGGGTVTCNINYSIIAGNNYKKDQAGKFNNSRDLDPYSGTTFWAKSQTGRNIYYGGVIWQKTVVEGNIVLTNDVDISSILNTTLSDNGSNQLPNLPNSTAIQRLKTHALVANSRAINPTAATTGVQTVDQRGFSRDQTPDMGAFEFGATANTKKGK